TTASRLVNERQPFETVETMLAILNGRELKGPYKVAVAGMAFKGVPETDDLRGSMALKVLEALAATGKMEEIRIFDPVISVDELKKLPQKARAFAAFSDALQGAHLTIICNNHKFFAKVRADEYFARLDPNGIVYDYWNNLEHESPENLQGRYFTVGNASLKRAL
ncbi:MAG: UDP-glucose/GDP-mannose dehydrogenase family protein, partial [Chakrabartia sp.]